MSLQDYRAFIASKARADKSAGFTPKQINPAAKSHQAAVLDFALNKGRSAAFLDTGLGKSFIELEFARQCSEETGKPSIILTPLAVAGQMVREGRKFGIDARHVCPLQLDTIENCLRLYSKPGDVVMDPFNGIGSTGYQAVKMMRRYIGFELKPEYAKQADRNLKDAAASVGDLFGVAA